MTTLNIYQKLVELRKEVTYLKKDKAGHNYNYASGTSLLAALRPKMDELGLFLFTSITDQKLEHLTYTKTKYYKGQEQTETVREYIVSANLVYTWINAENPTEQHQNTLFGAAIDNVDPAKAVGKMYTYMERYNLLKSLQIATDMDDPDAFQQKYDMQPPQQPQQIPLDQLPPEQRPPLKDRNPSKPHAPYHDLKEQEYAILEMRYEQGKGSNEGFAEWVNKQLYKGKTYDDMLIILNRAVSRALDHQGQQGQQRPKKEAI